MSDMEDTNFLEQYFAKYQKAVFGQNVFSSMLKFKKLIEQTSSSGGRVFFAGNGASAAIASHCALDFTKQGKIRSQCFNEAALLTAFSNDYGYDQWVVRALTAYAEPEDLVVLISSSGRSPNMVNAAGYARNAGMKVVTFTGFAPDNPLKALGDVNFWVDSQSYNLIECTHMFWLMAVCDFIIGKAEYKTSDRGFIN